MELQPKESIKEPMISVASDRWTEKQIEEMEEQCTTSDLADLERGGGVARRSGDRDDAMEQDRKGEGTDILTGRREARRRRGIGKKP